MRRVLAACLLLAGGAWCGSALSATLNLPSVAVTTAPAGSLLPHDSDARANWRMAGMLSQGGIPARPTICATVAPLGGGQSDTANIQAKIAACPLGQTVALQAGTFTIAEGSTIQINRGITLRGAGAGATILTRTGGATSGSYQPGSNPSWIVNVGNIGFSASQSTALSVDGAGGATSVQVASTTGLSVGAIVLVDEASGATWQKDAAWSQQVWASPDYRVVWQKHNPSIQYVDDFASGQLPSAAGSAGCWFSNCDRPTNELKRISAISGNTVTFDSPLTISYRVSHQALLHFSGAAMLQNAGVENLSASHGDAGGILFQGCAYCWAKNVEVSLWLNDGFDLINSFRVQLEGVYVHNAAWPVNGGGGYAISFAWGSSEALIENSISMLTNKVMVARSSGAGSVIGYNYMDDGYINGQDGWVEIGLNGSHMVGSHHMLFEGNQSFNMDSDTTHGNSIYHTFFRNYASGFRAPFTGLDGQRVDDATQGNGPLRAGAAHEYSYWFAFIGNVLGTPGKMTGWVYNSVGGPNAFPPKAIWTFGVIDITPQGTDPQVLATATLDGNYDYVTNSVKWAASDTAHVLPNSFYLPSRPAFFAAGKGYTWPWVVPAGVPQLYVLPAKARFDAGTPFVQP